jgi:hypothetical protein
VTRTAHALFVLIAAAIMAGGTRLWLDYGAYVWLADLVGICG